jgi:hypothetical protein
VVEIVREANSIQIHCGQSNTAHPVTANEKENNRSNPKYFRVAKITGRGELQSHDFAPWIYESFAFQVMCALLIDVVRKIRNRFTAVSSVFFNTKFFLHYPRTSP